MNVKSNKKIICCCAILLFIACREKYILPDTGPALGYLVVEGSINSGQGTTNIRLSRTVGLVDTLNINTERFASIWVEGDDNSSYVLTEASPGVYTNLLNLDNSRQYRLRIQTSDGSVYLSDFEKALTTPAIDTITWEQPAGVEIFVNTHDNGNNTQYYRWEYEETFEFHSAFYSSVKFIVNPLGIITDVVERSFEESQKLYTCWKTEYSDKILIGSSTNLIRDSIHLPIQMIPYPSWKLSVLYSINVRQSSINSKEYDFLRRMKKNTEQVGSLFDAQPSELKGNIHNVTRPNEIVIGYIGVADVKEKRIFISRSQLTNWNYSQGCQETKVKNDPDSLSPFTIPLYGVEYFGIKPQYYMVTEPICGDCTLRGYNTKPSFWP